MNSNKFNFDKFYFAIIEEDKKFNEYNNKDEILDNQRKINERLNRIQLDQLLMQYENGLITRELFLVKVEEYYK